MMLTILIFCFVLAKEESEGPQGSFTSKTYLYFGNSFESRYNSKIDTLNYSWADSFANGNLIKRYYPAFERDFIRTESYQYDEESRLKMITKVTKSKLNIYETVDSIVYNYLNDTTHTVAKSIADEGLWKELWTTKGDTTLMEQIINGVSAFTSREYLDNQNRKHSQIIKPELSNIENVYVYNDRGEEIQIIRIEDGISEISSTKDYKYDSEGRIVEKTIYRGNKKEIFTREITLYK